MVIDKELKHVGLKDVYKDRRLGLDIEENDKSKDKLTGETHFFGTAYYDLRNGKSKVVPFELVYVHGEILRLQLHQDTHSLTYGLQKLLKNRIKNKFESKW